MRHSKKCQKCAESIDSIYGLNTINVSSFLPQGQQKEINNLVEKIDLSNYENSSVYKGKDFKNVALYLVILKYKLKQNKIKNNEQLNYFKNELLNCIRSYECGINLREYYKSDILIAYNMQYGVNNSFYMGYKHEELRVYTMNGSNNNYYKHSLIRFWDWEKHGLVSPAKFHWDQFNTDEVSKKYSFIVKKHVKTLYEAKSPFVYSVKKQGRSFKEHELKKFQNVALLTMSSFDESLAARTIGAFPESKTQSNIFSSQLEWVDYTIKFFIDNPKNALIIRIHPREINNKRENKISEHYSEMSKYFKNLKSEENIYINYPQDKISFYDLIEQVDFVISNTSVTVIESLYHNKPVVVYDNEMSNYPDSILHTGKNRNDYIQNLNYMFDNSNPDTRENAIKWWSFKQGFGNLKLKYNFHYTFLFRAIRKTILIINIDYFFVWFNKIELKLYILENNSKNKLIECLTKGLDNLYNKKINENIKFLKK